MAGHVRDRWRARSATLGRAVRATGTDGGLLTGTDVDVDDAGGLVLATADGPRTVTSGAVEHLRPA